MTSPKRQALGKGIGALIPTKKPETPAAIPTAEEKKRGVMSVPIEEVRPNKSQPRRSFDDQTLEDLAASIREHGLMQPILVRQVRDQGFEIIAGERRWRACQKAGLKTIDVIVKDLADTEVFEWALIENIQREDLNPIEEAEAYKRLLTETGMTQETLAVRVSKDRSTIANSLRLLKLPDEVRRQVIAGAISMGHARALLALDSPEDMIKTARDIVKRGLSVREVERLVRLARRKTESEAGPSAPDPFHAFPGGSSAVHRATESLIRTMATKVRIVPAGKRGKIEIDFSSPEELDRLIALIQRS